MPKFSAMPNFSAFGLINIIAAMLQICENIRLARKGRKLSQDVMADKLGVPRTTYQSWEKDIEPDLTKILAIAKVLEIPAFELLRGIIEFEASGDETSRQERDAEEHITIVFNAQELKELKESLSKLNSILNKHPESNTIHLGVPFQKLPLDNKAAPEKKGKQKGTSQ